MKQGWQIKKLGEVCIKCNNIKWDVIEEGDSFLYIDLTSVDRDDLCIHNPQTINRDNAPSRAKQIVRTDDVIFATTRPTLRRVSLIGEKHNNAICSTGFCVLRSNKEILPQFVFYALQGDDFYKYIEPLQTGASYPAVTDGVVKNFSIPVPSLSEQQRIVALLDAEFAKIDALKANAEKNLQNAKDLFQAALKKELEPKEGWKKKSIKDVCSIFGRIGYRGYTRNDLVDNAVDGAITLSPSNIVDNEMVYDKVTYISWFKYEESPEIMIFDDDILLVKTGSSYGKCALVRNLPHKATINPQFVVLKNISINKGFLNYYLRTPYSKARFDEFVSGTAIPTFSQANLGNMTITFPSKEDQQSIVEHLDALNEKCKTLQSNYEKTLSLCDDLKQALLRKAFNGEI